ncbi:MAG: hypothetical protein KJO69_06890, partial [Gammaproteobacteria bacterium]|nr:hypothetical protein [Gammaproteobacteria bacterium]
IPGFTIIALLIGLPIALIVAWAFELTPDGLMKTDEVPQDASIAPNTGQRINYVIIGVLISAVIFFAYDKWFSPTSTSSENVAVENQLTVITDKTIAVLPFVSFSGDDSIGWLADGLTEEILNTLVKTRDLKVSSRTSSFSYKGTNKPVAVIAKELGVAHILEGSVRQSGERTRITAQLIRATDGFHLWSETYDSTSKDIIQIQEDIAIQIATAMQTAMDPEALSNMMSSGTTNVAAYEAYLEALSTSSSSSLPLKESVTKSLALYEKAISLDPSFASAHQRLVEIYFSEMATATGSYLIITNDFETAKKLFFEKANRALDAINEPIIESYIQLYIAQVNLNFIRARELVDRLLTEYPKKEIINLGTQQIIFTLIVHNERDRLKALSEEFWAVSTHDTTAVNSRVIGHVWSSDLDNSYEMAKEMVALFPSVPNFAYQAHRLFLWLGKLDDARKLVPVATSGEAPKHWHNIIRLRQACAEGRQDDAEKISQTILQNTSEADNDYTVIFQTHMMMNRKKEAHDHLRSLEDEGNFFALIRNMYYPYFDVNEFPKLKDLLISQGIPIPEYVEIPFACK